MIPWNEKCNKNIYQSWKKKNKIVLQFQWVFSMGIQHPSNLNAGKLIDQSNDLYKSIFKKPLFYWLTNQLTTSKYVTNKILLKHNLCWQVRFELAKKVFESEAWWKWKKKRCLKVILKSIDNKVWINNDMYISTLIWNEHLFFIFSHETGEDMQNIGIFSILFLY